MDELATDLARYCRVMDSLFPGLMRSVFEDENGRSVT
jgi:hypothetical protein